MHYIAKAGFDLLLLLLSLLFIYLLCVCTCLHKSTCLP